MSEQKNMVVPGPMTGRCLCGAVRFAAHEVETHHHACHCGMCRRWAGGPFLAALAGAIAFEGAANIGVHATSDWAERGFCTTCGSHLFWRLRASGLTMVSVGAFDDPAPFRLAGEIFVDGRPAGHAFAGDLPQMTEAEAVAMFTGAGADHGD